MEVTLLVVRVCPFVPSKTKCRPQDRNKNKAEENFQNIDGLFIAYINRDSQIYIGPGVSWYQQIVHENAKGKIHLKVKYSINVFQFLKNFLKMKWIISLIVSYLILI